MGKSIQFPSRPASHRPCRFCRRLLAPANGQVPRHRVPPERVSEAKNVPLTGADAPWCDGGGEATVGDLVASGRRI
jgi:hypothetical protein